MKSNLPENITERELESIQESLLVTSARKLKGAVYDEKDLKGAVYDEKDKQEIAKYAPTYGFAAALRKIKEKFPNINEITLCTWVKKCKDLTPPIRNTRGPPLLLDE